MADVKIEFNSERKSLIVDGVELSGDIRRASVDCAAGEARLIIELVQPYATLTVDLGKVELSVSASAPPQALRVLKAIVAGETTPEEHA